MIFDFGYRLRELRISKNLTQTQAAKRLELSKTTISGYENNIKTPSLETLTKMAVFYGVSADYILGLENRKMIPIDGLTAAQEEIVRKLLNEFKKGNRNKKRLRFPFSNQNIFRKNALRELGGRDCAEITAVSAYCSHDYYCGERRSICDRKTGGAADAQKKHRFPAQDHPPRSMHRGGIGSICLFHQCSEL